LSTLPVVRQAVLHSPWRTDLPPAGPGAGPRRGRTSRTARACPC